MADIVTSRVFVDGEKGITAAKLNDIVASSVIQPAFYTSKPTAGTADPADIALILKSGAYAQVPVSTLGGSATQSQIWSTRLSSFNAVGNPNFEVDQRNVGNLVTAPLNGIIVDRWNHFKTGAATLVVSGQQVPQNVNLSAVAGPNFLITRSCWRYTLTAAQVSLATGDLLQFYQSIEGPQFRELAGDVTSISVLVRSSVAGVKFSLGLQDVPVSKSLVKLATIPAANTWTLLQFPNIPLMTGGNFTTAPGVAGYTFTICLATGATYMAPAADTWQSGNFKGAPGMSNFAASPLNSTFDIAFVQHEPGAVCSTFMDKPFKQNYDECLRYYQKTYDYEVPIQTANSAGAIALTQIGTTACAGPVRFHKPMAKIPTMVAYSYSTGSPNAIRIGGTDYPVSGFALAGKTGFAQLNGTLPANALGSVGFFHYTADTGW